MSFSKSFPPSATFFTSLLLAALFTTSAAEANALYFRLFVDPPTTAFSGIPAVDGFSGASNRSGPGTWHLYAIDDIDNSFGISAFNVKLNPGSGGTIPAISNRSPATAWFDIDDDGPFNAGFTGLRSPTNSNPVTGIQGAVVSSTPPIGGYGISASDFKLKTGGQTFTSTTNGQWGKYADYAGGAVPYLPSGHSRYPLFLAEGTYTGGQPSVDLSTSGGTAGIYWTDANLTTFAPAPQLANYPLCSCGITIFDGNINNVNANNPGFVDYTFTYLQDLPSSPNLVPMIWSNFNFQNYLPPGSSVGSGNFSAQPATFDPATHTFHWNTINATPGTYTWGISASAEGYTGNGFLRVTVIPEPTSLALIVAVLPGLLTVGRRRRA